ncbi:hypothetical protein RI570_14235 [Brucella pseudogrignonensis]|uniref:hypothetical protein n=1 Tax=Brucella pseudogrignonensis TaxID=419475 RepID=UPI0028B908C3|nr:hypothetical protein [Brucella pseudogrignonensis]MDT6941282.1 hypothetical protein [Brucella pseudogrignonensis]
MASDGGVVPELASRTGYAFLVQCARYRARADACGELSEDAPDNICLGFVDFPVAANGITPRVELLDDVVAEAEPAA